MPLHESAGTWTCEESEHETTHQHCWSPLLISSPAATLPDQTLLVPAEPEWWHWTWGQQMSPSSCAWHPRCFTPGLAQVGECTTGGKRWLSCQKSPAFVNSDKQTLRVLLPSVLPPCKQQLHHNPITRTLLTLQMTTGSHPVTQGCTQGSRLAPVCQALSPRPHPP